jgi:replication factor C subunit 2/4
MSFFKKKETGSSSDAPKKNVPWVEKYRPKNLDDVAAQDHAVTVLKRTLQSANLPHMLFYGPPGTGKTSTVLALAKELYGTELMKSRVLELNASDERGISIVREKIKNFARSVVSSPSEHARKNYPCPPYKIIILDEADSMTSDAQSALRRTMETYSRITRFCLICNYVTRIIDPLASRCSKFRFKPLDEANALSRLQFIARQESVRHEEAALSRLLETSGGDLRKAITLLQSCARLRGAVDVKDEEGDIELGEDQQHIVTVDIVNEISGTVPDQTIQGLIVACRANESGGNVFKRVQRVVEDVIYSGWSASQMVVQIHDVLLVDEFLTGMQKGKISWILSEVDKNLTDGADEHLAMLSMMTRIANVVNA